MIKLLLALIMMFAFGTSTVNAEENATRTEDRINELAEINSDSQSTIKDKVDELSEDELETIIANVDELTEPTEEDLAIKEAAVSKLNELSEQDLDDLDIKEALGINKLEETESVETSDLLPIGVGVLGLILMFSALIMLFMGYRDESRLPFLFGILSIIIMKLLAKWWVQNWESLNKGE